MIQNTEALQTIRTAWTSVRVTEAKLQTVFSPVHIGSVIPIMTGMRELSDSLLLVFAVSVIEDTLRQLHEEKAFTAKNTNLKSLMTASALAVPWQDLDAFNKEPGGLRERRNDVAHRQAVLSPGECSSYIHAIERELLAWRILVAPVKAQYTITMTSSDRKPD